MTGPEHYREAEQCLTWASMAETDGDNERFNLAAAQVHATLALAAATALGREGEGRMQPSQDRNAWFDAAAECRKATEVTA